MTTFYWYKYRIRLYLRDVISFIIFILLRIRAHFAVDKQKGVRILVYHSIKKVPKNKDILRITVPPELFEKHIKYLICSKYDIISMDDLLDYISGNYFDDQKVVLTFDDGFDDNFHHGYNILNKNKLTAAFFLVPNYIGSNEIFPWYDKNSPYSKPISWEQVRKLVSSGMNIGSHTLTHQDLGHISQDKKKF